MVLAIELVILVGSETTWERQKSEYNWLRRLLGDGDEVRDGADETSMLKSLHKIIFDQLLKDMDLMQL